MTTEHQDDIRQAFDDTLTDIRQRTVQIGGLVLENLRRASEAILENKFDLAGEVIDADDEVDRRYINTEQEIFETMARQQPVATDLRFLVAFTRVLYELERSGDLVVNCAKTMRRLDGITLSPELRGILTSLTTEAAKVFGRGIDSLADLDAELGKQLDAEDEVVDDLVSDFYNTLVPQAEQHGFEQAMALSRIGRYMERIADHAVNVGEHVAFIVEGSFPDHSAAVKDEGP